MFRHLLVPVDGTALSIETVGKAVDFARTLGATITFFHAAPDYAASLLGEASVVALTSPAEYAYAYEGRSRELLAKAEAAAHARGVPCDSRSATSDSPYEAILAAARASGCDLIFMASHGRRSRIGMMLGSQTLKVLVNTDIPVLVAATANPAPPARALGIIRDEHRSLSAVLHAWMHLLARARRTGGPPDATLMRAIVRYLQQFPAMLHHPKEDSHLFRKLRERTSTLDAELAQLEQQHELDHELIAELAVLVAREGGADLDALEAAVGRYAAFIWDHLGREESVILPAAERHLTAEDWAEVEAVFSANQDPNFGADVEFEYRRLFSRIVNLVRPDAA